MKEQFLYGGQAIIEGVMIRGRSHAAIAVRTPGGDIVTRPLSIGGWTNGRAREIPLLRGVAILVETVVMGVKALTTSAELAAQESGDDSEPLPAASIVVILGLAFFLGIVFFFLIPLFISRGLEGMGASHTTANVAEGLLRLAFFIGYLWAVGRMKDVGRVFSYHGAEHMAVSAQEHGAPLSVETLRRFPIAHPRCGTAFLLTVILVSIIVFMLFPRDSLWLLVTSRIVLVPLIAAISYEIIRFNGRHRSNPWVRLLDAPSLMTQKLTTRQPDNGQIEVAIRAVEYAMELDAGSAGTTDTLGRSDRAETASDGQ